MDSVILENYSSFIDDHKTDLNSKNGIMSILTEDNYYQAYANKLVEGMDEHIAKGVLGVLGRNRDVLLESFSAGAVQPLGWTVMS